MTIDYYMPAKKLSPFIKAYLVIESQDGLENRVLPDTSLVMVFRFKGMVKQLVNSLDEELPSFVVTGLRRSGKQVNYSGNSGNVLVLFNETGAAAFFKEPLHELFEENIPLGDLNGYKNLSGIEERLCEATDNGDRIRLVEEFLLSRLGNYDPDKLILAALEKIHASKGLLRIKELADSLYISQDAFEKRFRKIVGTSPKQFSNIVRMKSIISDGRQNHVLADLAFNAGYFDQPHFNKDFKLFTGQTPKDFFKSSPLW